MSTSDFPKTKCSLWDKASKGVPVFLNVGSYRKPRICLPEKVLKLIQHQCEHYNQTSHVLVGTLVVEEDGEGVQFQVDRLDTREHIPPDGSGLAPGDLLIPLEVTNNKAKERAGTVEEYSTAIRRLQDRCCSKSGIDLSSFVLLRGWGSFYSNAHTSVVHLDFDMVTMATTFKATPISPVPIVLTALSKNLAGPMSLSHMQGTPKTGFLTMDHTRKLLLVLESDPKAATLPIIGIWVSGTELLQHPFVWTSCLRYIHSTHLQDRVCSPPEEFLLVLYTPLHSRPEFYQCVTTSGNTSFQFQLYSGHDVGNLTKSLSSRSDHFAEVELEPATSGHKMEIFDAAKEIHSNSMTSSEVSGVRPGVGEDIEPRCAPTPHHMEKVPVIRPMVPDVSIMWSDTSDLSAPSDNSYTTTDPSMRPIHLSAGTTRPGFFRPPMQSYPHTQPAGGIYQQARPPYHGRSPGQLQSLTQISSQSPGLQHSVMSQAQSSWSNHPPAQSQWMPSTMQQSAGGYHYPEQRPAQSRERFVQVPQVTFQNGLVMAMPRHPQNGSCTQTSGQVSPLSACYHPSSSTVAQHFNPAFVQSPMVTPGYSTAPFSGNVSSYQESMNLTNFSPASSVGGHMHSAPGNSVPPSYQRLAQQAPSHQVSPNTGVTPSTNFSHNPPSLRMQPTVINTPVPQQYTMGSQSVQQSSRIAAPSGSSTTAQVKQAQSTNGPLRDFQTPMTFLKTVVEETSSSSSNSSRNGSQNIESRSESNMTRRSHNATAQNNSSSSSSSRSSGDDSGLSVTPERLNPSPPEQPAPGPVNAPGLVNPPSREISAIPDIPTANLSLDSVKWDQVPLEIRTLLMQQSEQLKQLQQQIQILLQNQSQLSAASASATAQPSLKQEPEKCSVAVNTSSLHDLSTPFLGDGTLDGPDPRPGQQTSPERPEALAHSSTAQSPQSDFGSPSEAPHPNGTPSELRHQGPAPVNSTEYRDFGLTSARSSEFPSEEDVIQRDLSAAVGNMNVYEQTCNSSVVSDLVVDMPDYASTLGNKSNFDQSPPSVSACYNSQHGSYSTVAEDATDPKQYYSQLMNNIQLFLANNASQDGEPCPVRNDQESALQTPVKSDRSACLPNINYMSMLLSGHSDTGQSMEINAMAMKYLNDDQLTQVARLQEVGGHGDSRGSSYSAKILQKVICGQALGAPSTPGDVSRLGMSPNNMSMGTRKYMEKYGLLGNDTMISSEMCDPSIMDYTYKLKTDFSMAASAKTVDFGDSYDADGSAAWSRSSSPMKSPVCQEVVQKAGGSSEQSSPVLDRRKLHNVTNSKDIGASPSLLPPKTYDKSSEGSPPVNPLAKARHTDQVTIQSSSCDQEDENLLDIEKLKQLPKLL